MRWGGISFIVVVMTLAAIWTNLGCSISYFSEVKDESNDVLYFSILDMEFHYVKGKAEIDILTVESRQEGERIIISMTVRGNIDKSGRSTYDISVVTNDDEYEDTYDSVTLSYNGTGSYIHFYGNQTRLDLDNKTTVNGNTLEFSVPQGFFINAVKFELYGSTEQWDDEDFDSYMDNTMDLPFDGAGDRGQYYWIYYLVISLIVVFAIVGFVANWKFKRFWKRKKARFCLICGGLMQDGDVVCRFCGHSYHPARK